MEQVDGVLNSHMTLESKLHQSETERFALEYPQLHEFLSQIGDWWIEPMGTVPQDGWTERRFCEAVMHVALRVRDLRLWDKPGYKEHWANRGEMSMKNLLACIVLVEFLECALDRSNDFVNEKSWGRHKEAMWQALDFAYATVDVMTRPE